MEVSQELAERERQRHSEAHAEYVKLVVRHDQLSPAEREKLYQLCGVLRIDANGLGRDTSAVAAYRQQQTFIGNTAKIEKINDAAAQAVQDFLAKKEQTLKELEAQLRNLHLARDQALRDLNGLREAIAARESLRRDHGAIVMALESSAA